MKNLALIVFVWVFSYHIGYVQGKTSLTLSPSELEIVHINIGQGSATLIRGPEIEGKRKTVLFDCGQTLTSSSPKDGGEIIYNVLASRGIREIDFLIISHYDADHLAGLVYGTHTSHRSSFALGQNNVPGAIGDDDGDGDEDWLNASNINFDFSEWGRDDDILIHTCVDRGTVDAPDTQTYKKYVAFTQAAVNHIEIESLEDIEGFSIDLGGGATLICLSANGIALGKGEVNSASSENERSISFLLEYGAFDYFIGGDLIGKRGTDSGPEDARLEYYVGRYLFDAGIHIDVLQTNHHGANNTSELGFLNLIKAEYAIVSVGENTYGHPHPDHLERLLGAGVQKIYQTNSGNPKWSLSSYVVAKQEVVNDHIILTSDGVSFSINSDIYVCDN